MSERTAIVNVNPYGHVSFDSVLIGMAPGWRQTPALEKAQTLNDQISILIVDDSHDKLVALEAVLSDLGLDLVCVQSGREALRCLLNRDFAAILLDVNMPGMDGFETASMIRQRRNSQSTPIIFITSYGDDPYVARGYALGAVDYMLTPVVPAVLRTKVTVFADLYRKSQEVRRQADKLQQRANQLAALSAEIAAVEQRERRRLAQLLHDNLQQLLVAARFRIGMFHLSPAERQKQIIDEIDDLLNQSIEASRGLTAELSPPILHDGGLVPALEWLARRMHKNHGLTVEVEGDANIDFSAESLRSFVFNAVRELLFNCVKHAGVTEATISVSQNENGCIEVTVSDNGEGFDPSVLDSHSPDRDNFGLFSIRERASLLQGEVEIVSSPRKGTSITLRMPDPEEPGQPSKGKQQSCSSESTTSDDTPSPSPSSASVSQAAVHSNGHSPAQTAAPSYAPVSPRVVHSNGHSPTRVIVADDHEIIRKGLVAYLENQEGIEVIGEAGDGAQAIEMTRSLRPDVVVMDVSMPGVNGIEATRVIRREVSATRVIALSLHKREDMASAMMLAGASAYLSKGGPPDALIAAVRENAATHSVAPSMEGFRLAADPEVA